MSVGLVATAVALLFLPSLARPLGRRMSPRGWRSATWISLVSGAVVVEVALVLHALPTVLRASGAPGVARLCERMLGRLSPGGALAGWTAASLATVAAVRAALAWHRARAELRVLRVEPALGAAVSSESTFDLVVLPTPRLLAYSRQGRPSQVVVSEGVLHSLREDELDLLVAHELSHLQRGDETRLVAIAVVRSAFGFVPGVSRSARVARTAIERAADEAAAGIRPERRQALARALAATAGCCVPEAAAALSAAETLEERIAALTDEPASSPSAACAVTGSTLVLALALALTAGTWVSQANRVLAMAGACMK